MNRNDFEGMCELFNDGKLIWVQNEQMRKQGRIVGCGSEMIEVAVENHCETWHPEECSEMTYGYRVRYDEVKKYPHEYDTHMD